MTENLNKEIENQLIWYQKAFPLNDENMVPNTFDSIQYVYEAFDRMKADDTKLFACERNNICECSNHESCICDSDDCYQVNDMDLILGSNNNIIFKFRFGEKVSIGQLKNIRFFTLHNKTDEECPVLDLMKEICKRKKRRVVKEVTMMFPCMKEDVKFPVDGNPKIRDNEIYFSLNYMNYL
jgi:hypothetical protein